MKVFVKPKEGMGNEYTYKAKIVEIKDDWITITDGSGLHRMGMEAIGQITIR